MAAFVLLLLQAQASAQVVNPSFEDSPALNGWTIAPGGVGSAPTTLNGVVNPTHGSRFGFITTEGDTDTSFPPENGTRGTILRQTFTAGESSVITLDYNFLTNESHQSSGFNDFAVGRLLDANGQHVMQIFFETTFSKVVSASGSGYNLQTGWKTATATIPVSGTLILEFGVSDRGDTVVDSALAVDNIRIAPRSPLIISEFRLRGPNGPNDEFVELYNPTLNSTTVTTSDGSAGWALVASDGVVRFVVPVGTVIPPRGHFLGVNSAGYSLSAYPAGNGTTATGDATYTLDIPDLSGIALFKTAAPVKFNLENRLDAVGYSSAPALYREGIGLGASGPETSNIEASLFRRMEDGTPSDTNNNGDFFSVGTTGVSPGFPQHLGAPGPENMSSPVLRSNAQITSWLLDPLRLSSAAPNRVRDTTPVTNGSLGTLDIRRTFVNNTGGDVTRLRFRIVNTTTYPETNEADLRALTSTDILVTRSDGSTVLVRGTLLEEPPSQPLGGGFHSTLSAGSITLATPLKAGDSISVRFLLGVQRGGTFRFYVALEALP